MLLLYPPAMNIPPTLPLLLAVLVQHTVVASLIGTNIPAEPLTPSRVEGLPEWKSYVEHSERQRAADMQSFQAELKGGGLQEAAAAPEARHGASGVDLRKPAEWFGCTEARRIASNLVTFQTPAGGWGKNTDFATRPRHPGEPYGAGNGNKLSGPADFDTPENVRWNYVGTFDNEATITELRFLAKVISASNAMEGATLRNAFFPGLEYVFAAQFPNGGWPQVWPLQGGYHDAITINDGAMLHVVEFLEEVASGMGEFSFVPENLRRRADASWRRGLGCILKLQIQAEGTATVWCQQYDALTLKPASARNYEMPSQCSSESAGIVLFLMHLPAPDPETVAAVHAAAAWFKKTEITGKKFQKDGFGERWLLDDPSSPGLWARYYEIGSDRPIFGDRDKSIHDDVNEISRERRNGYSWYNGTPRRVLDDYPGWSVKHPRS